MALDAVFGQDGSGFAVGMKAGIKEALKENIEEKRLDALLRIRNTMLHGGASDLFASSNYLGYAQKYPLRSSSNTLSMLGRCLEFVQEKSLENPSDRRRMREVQRWCGSPAPPIPQVSAHRARLSKHLYGLRSPCLLRVRPCE
ncbi:hypothetical protein AGR6A_Cc140229 [Agrobacterium sp. NCPPB 925]|nr:hypothetical protein AGR6A_Cc140229 [Agrobacterium sp. NCPPB 925]